MDEFKITKNPMPKISVPNSGNKYLFELYEHKNGLKLFVHDTIVNTNSWSSYYREWYGDWEFVIYKWDDSEGLIKVHEERYNSNGKNVLIILDTEFLNESFIWFQSALRYKEKYGCNLYIKSSFNSDLKDISPTDVIFLTDYNEEDMYSIYHVGKYDVNYEWNRRLTDMLYNKIVTRNGEYCSYRNPIDWHYRALDDVANDILGLSD